MRYPAKLFFYVTTLSFVLASCSLSTDTISVSYEKSNSVLIQKSIKDLNATEILNSSIDENEKITICSIEQSITDDSGISAQIEDELIKEFVNKGYTVLERDYDMIGRMISESSDTYQLFNRLKKYEYENAGSNSYSKMEGYSNSSSSSNINGSSYDNGSSNLTGLGLYGSSNSYGSSAIRGSAFQRSSSGLFGSSGQSTFQNKREVENYNQYYATNLSSTDKIISYRIIECGITYSEINDDDIEFEFQEKRRVKRNARTILELRVTEAKSGEIIDAVRLDGTSSDEIRLAEFKKLDNFGYRNYHPSLPKVYGNPSLINDNQINEIYTKSKNKKGGYILGGMGLLAIIIIAASS
ncbi:MAG: hypothetical protein CMB32_06500 [Euryarchaeota archaeon]|nr:hypothetical protein [Euryarchaeota archaeon]